MTERCPQRADLERLLSDQLDPTTDAIVSKHVEACSRCQDVLAELSTGEPSTQKRQSGGNGFSSSMTNLQCDALRTVNGTNDIADGVIQRLKERLPDSVHSQHSREESTIPQVPGYEIEAEIGRGGMGVIYRARQVGLDRVVALKRLQPGIQRTSTALARLRAEAAAVSRLHHPNIVQIFDVLEHACQPYLVLEFVAGRSLRDHLDGTPRPAQEAAALIETVARAMDAAHSRGIVHRDLKPANILLDIQPSSMDSASSPLATATPKITDFGLAKLLDRDSSADESLTKTGEVLGTPNYMAPEQARATGGPLGPQADVYALGVVLYELLTGRPPFAAATPLGTLMRVVHEDPVSVTRLSPTVPRDLATVTMKCLEKEPARRYATAGALADDLARFQAGRPILAQPTGPTGRAWRWCRRNPAVASLLASLALVFVGGFGTALWEASQARDAATGEGLARQQAEAKASEAKANLYAAQMNLVQTTWRDAHIRQTFDLLDACRPTEPGERDLRGWEWQHQFNLCHDELREFVGHKGWVLGVAFSPDGARLASAGYDHTIRIWDVATRRSLNVLHGHSDEVTGIAFSPDGKRLVSGSGDHTIKLWDAANGREIQTFKGHTDHITSVTFSLDGRLIASSSWDLTARIWDAASGRELHQLRGIRTVACVAFSPDGNQLATSSSDGNVRIWDLAHGTQKQVLQGHVEDVEGVVFSPDGRLLASCGWDRTVRIWNLAAGRETQVLRGHTNWVYRAAFSPDGRRLASAGWDGMARIWDVASGRLIRIIRGHTNRIHDIAYSPDGALLATASADGSIKLWSAAGGEEFRGFPGLTTQVEAIGYSPDGRRLASASGADVQIWDADAGVQLTNIQRHDLIPIGELLRRIGISNLPPSLTPSILVKTVAFSPDGKRIASGSADGVLRICDADTGRVERDLRHAHGGINAVAFIPTNGRLVSAGDDGVVRIWDVASGQVIESLQGRNGNIVAIAVSLDGRWLASAAKGSNGSGEIRVWNLESGGDPKVLTTELPDVKSLAFSPNGQWLASGAAIWEERGEIQLWDPASGQLLRTIRGHDHWITGLSFSPDSTRLASAGHDNCVKLWDPVTGQQLRSLVGQRRFLCVAFHPDGTRIVAGCQDNPALKERTIKLWDARPLNDNSRAEREAFGIVEYLFGRPLPRVDVMRLLCDRAVLSAPARDMALRIAERFPEVTDADSYFRASWSTVCQPRLKTAQYEFAYAQASAASRVKPGETAYRIALAGALYRVGSFEQSQEMLNRVGPLTPAGTAFLAMTYFRLGQQEQARTMLDRIRESPVPPGERGDTDGAKVCQEAGSLLASE